MLFRKRVAGTNVTNSLIKTLSSIITLAGDVFIGKVFRNLQKMAVQLEQVKNASSLARPYICLHSGRLKNQMNGQLHKSDGQNAPEKEEAFQLSAGRSYAPMHRLSLLPVCHPYKGLLV